MGRCYAGTKRRGVSCFTKAQLVLMCQRLDLEHAASDTKRVLWERLNREFVRRFGCADADEQCWSRSSDLGEHALVPTCPMTWRKDPRTWLTNIDILKAMEQYERRYPSFKFAGVFPIDFATKSGGGCISDVICDMRLKTCAERYGRLGFVFNLDKHDEPGSHWVAMYVGLRPRRPNYGTFYYDSNGDIDAPKEIDALQARMAAQMADPKFRVAQNTRQQQYENSECGMFVIHFLIECLKNRPFDEIVASGIRDEDMNRLRFETFSC